ncbi:MAG: Ribosomal RNA small subunit methyltransferase G [Candidatus Accumulibacter appositus]|uniref:Ribosomal RNA small subunit methyltransferase G n=1 Tax=Candidatus Accumulibacter appositus TaxID=1454003 RepID=A0A011N4E4_9PROT|nr:16S rRNA (guanine(527)-N(7))-methyltransferase RsmG [Accumulibacter sp.]EXI77413.1 MAG: Ribosomal RNA small subunit methyltransferase G [Candidatus Accumulibacter appositus]HRF04797.1 16S rRNA (guanine(527)-N(7))-methyltransferase RsmG [Accumulibacter sp.]
MSAAQQLEEGLQDLGIALPTAAQNKLLAYASLLEKWNRTYRLTAVPNTALAVSHHLLDSLAVLPYVHGESLLDVGSGGGMPGIPLAIARPDLRVVLLDSNSKKSAFLRQAAIELELANIAVHCGRVEAYRPADAFAAITARAFADLAALVSLSRHLLQAGGHWLAMKGVCPQAELARLPADVVVDAIHRLEVPGVTGERHLVRISSRAVGH